MQERKARTLKRKKLRKPKASLFTKSFFGSIVVSNIIAWFIYFTEHAFWGHQIFYGLISVFVIYFLASLFVMIVLLIIKERWGIGILLGAVTSPIVFMALLYFYDFIFFIFN